MQSDESASQGAEPAHDVAGRLRALLDAAQSFGRLAVWERDPVTGEGTWDPHVFDLFGLSRREQAPTFADVLQCMDPGDAKRMRQVYRASLTRPGRHEARYKVVRPDGGVAHLHSIWQVPADGGRVVGVLIDDSESVLQAQQHDVERMQLSLVSKLVGMSLWRTDLATQRIFRGDHAWHATRLEPGEEGVPVAELRGLIHPDDLAAADEASRQALAGQGAAMVETRYRTPEGGYRTMLTRRTVQRDAAGQAVAVLGVGLDITEQVQTRERYRELLERYDLAVDATGIGVWTWDLDQNTIEWNAAMRAIYGLPAEPVIKEIIGDNVTDAVLPDDRHAVRAMLRRACDAAAPRVEVTYRIQRPDGEQRTLVGRARRLEGQRALVCGIVIDVTELNRAEQLRHDKEAAERADRAKGAFLSRVSHELRTPLNAVLGFTGLLTAEAGPPLHGQQRLWLAQVQQAGQHLLGLVDDLLDLGREEPLAGADRAQQCDLIDVIEQVVAWHAEAARAARVHISISGACLRASGSERHWRQVVTNLVSNAIKYNRSNGLVQIVLNLDPDPAWLTLSVRDNGRGLSEAQQRHLFEPFNRLGAERFGIDGSGLGLSIVRQIITALGGDIAVSSQPDRGTTVRVRAPCAGTKPDQAPLDLSPAKPDIASPASAGSSGPLDLVYVEDNPVNVLLVQEFLAQRQDVRVHVAGTVAEGLALVMGVRPRLVLLDLHLPDGSGYDLLASLATHGVRQTLHCVALSADVMPDEVQRALTAGFDEHWAKPIDMARFLAGIDRLLASPLPSR